MSLARVLNKYECDMPAQIGQCEAREPMLVVLRRKKELLEEQISRVQAAITALEQNPGVQEVLDTISVAL